MAQSRGAFCLSQKESSSPFKNLLNSAEFLTSEAGISRCRLLTRRWEPSKPFAVSANQRQSCPMYMPTVGALNDGTLWRNLNLAFLLGKCETTGEKVSDCSSGGGGTSLFLRMNSSNFSVDVISFKRAKPIPCQNYAPRYEWKNQRTF